MRWLQAVVLSVCVYLVRCKWDFPPDFKFGAATAAYQVEGGWNVSDKSESIWDSYVHKNPQVIVDLSNGDIACDSYHQWRRDVEMASELGLHFYRFSIAWTRLVPNGFPKNVSEDGKKYYNNIINALLERGIEPVVTLYHFDLPQTLQNLGGWTNPLIVDWFGDYARIVYSLFADRVKTWITINEPLIFCEQQYGRGLYPPAVDSPGFGSYLCSKHSILAHAKAWRIYDEEYKAKYQGKVSLSNQLIWYQPADGGEEDAADLARQLGSGLFSHPIYSKEGGWPPLIEKIIARKSKEEGHSRSRLPDFTEEEKKFVRGTYDFYGFNYYTSRTARKAREGDQVGAWPLVGAPDIDVVLSVRPEWVEGGTGWLYIHAEGIRRQLSWIKQQYGNLTIYITENGLASYDSDLYDLGRIEYFKEHLEQVLLAIKEDGINVTRYTAWTLMDNFEWTDGYRSKFGLYEVDFNDTLRTRRSRASARYYSSVIRTHSLDVENKEISNELCTICLISLYSR